MKKRILLLTLCLLNLNCFAAESSKTLPSLEPSEDLTKDRKAATLFAARYCFVPTKENIRHNAIKKKAQCPDCKKAIKCPHYIEQLIALKHSV